MAVRYACSECDYVSDDSDYTEDHSMETGHAIREVEFVPVVDDEG